jgi:catechol 2,3-dioxygenase-like lactoylglutathione lyase family enzyme
MATRQRCPPAPDQAVPAVASLARIYSAAFARRLCCATLRVSFEPCGILVPARGLLDTENMLVRGIEHIGITVPNVDEAARYFAEAFGAELLYDTHPRGSEPFGGAELEQLVGVPPETELITFRMLRLPDGPSIELFEYSTPDQRSAVCPADLGLQHVALYVDDIDLACERIRSSGGEVLVGPRDLPGPEAGPGNQWCYTRAPWGMTIELVTFPSPQAYEKQTTARRWKPGSA